MDQKTYRQLDAVEIARLVNAGDIDPGDVTEAALVAAAEVNPAINAIVLLDEQQARQQASRVDRTAPLAGVPILIKDNNLFVEGWPTTFGSKFYEGAPPQPESSFIQRLRASGAVVLGKTNTPEFASDWTTEPTWRGPTRNPWNLDHSPGGSSGGSAAAVAAGIVPAAHGNDNAGSIRVPSAWCGIFGLKPTRGLVPVGPAFPELAAGLDCEHVLARSVRDSAAFLDCLAGPELGGQFRVERAVPSYLASIEQAPARLRVGLVTRRPDSSAVDPEITAAIERVALVLEQQGHRIEPIAMPHDPRLALESEKIYFAETACFIRQRAREIGRDPRPQELEAISHLALDRTRKMDVVEYLEARQNVHRIALKLSLQMQPHDVILTPTTALTAPRLGVFDSRTERFDYEHWCAFSAQFAPFTDIFNATGQPAASVPIGRANSGLPIGAQIAAGQGRDELVLQVSRQIELCLKI